MMIHKHRCFKYKSLRYLGLFFTLVVISYGQTYKQIKPFIWPLNLTEVIIYSPNTSITQFNLSHIRQQIVEEVNPLGYYKLKIQNKSKSFKAYRNMINILRKDKSVSEVYPIFKVKGQSSSINFKQIGFSKLSLKDSKELYKKLINLTPVFPRIFESSFRSYYKKVIKLMITFDIENGVAMNIKLSAKGLTPFIEKEIRSLLENQKWINSEAKISIKMRSLVYKEV